MASPGNASGGSPKSVGRKIGDTVKWSIVAIVGLGLFLVPGIERAWTEHRLATNGVAEATILGWDSSSGSYRFAYRYTVDGRHYGARDRAVPEGMAPDTYCADRHDHVQTQTRLRVGPGDTLPVAFDPDDPADASLVEPPGAAHYWYLAGLFVCAVGALAIWSTWRGPPAPPAGRDGRDGDG